jgi:hypothetical protein
MGFFYKVFLCDVMAMSVDVLFSKKGGHNRNLIYTSRGPSAITLPVHAHHDEPLSKARLVEPEYNVSKVIKNILQEYADAPHFREGVELTNAMKEATEASDGYMADYNIYLIKYISSKFGFKTDIITTEALSLDGHKDERIIDLCKKLNADTYLSGEGARVYHVPEKYSDNQIELTYSHYSPVHYRQVHGPFVKNLSVVDYVFNCGFLIPDEWVK